MTARAVLRVLRAALIDPQYRRDAWLRVSRPKGVFQPHGTTAEDRYPAIFSFARKRIGDAPTTRLLSFGCSTGAEAFALRRYFDAAAIKGIDINSANIRSARARLRRSPDPGIAFAVASGVEGEADASFDAIFCMAVFRHGGLGVAPPRCDHLIRFEDFERAVADIARCVKPGGLLVVRHSNFRFADTSVAAGFEAILRVPPRTTAPTPIYGPDNRLLDGVVSDEAVFQRR